MKFMVTYNEGVPTQETFSNFNDAWKVYSQVCAHFDIVSSFETLMSTLNAQKKEFKKTKKFSNPLYPVEIAVIK